MIFARLVFRFRERYILPTFYIFAYAMETLIDPTGIKLCLC